MAQRFGFQFSKTLAPEVFLLDGYVNIGATGAVGALDNKLSLWVKSITRNSTGNYTVVLTDLWDSLGLVQAEVISNNSATDYSMVKVVSFQPGSVATTSPFATTTASIVIQVSSGGSAADPPSGGGIQFLVLAHNNVAV